MVIIDKLQRIFIFEGIGTIIFAYGIGCAGSTSGQDMFTPPDGVLIACSLLAGLALCAELTEGHLNPLLAVASHTKKSSRYTWIQILGQFIGGFLGVVLFWIVTGKTIIPVVHDPLNQDGVDGFKQILKYSLNQLIGSFFFGILVLTITNHLTSFATKSWQKYLLIVTSLFLVRKMTGQTALNPGIAVPAQLFSSLIDSQHAQPLKCLIVLFPSLFGGFIAGLVMKKFYEPLLLYTNFKIEIESEVEVKQQNQEND